MEMEGLDLETQVEGKIRLETGQAEKTLGRWFSEWIWKATFVDLLGWVAGTAARTAVRSRDRLDLHVSLERLVEKPLSILRSVPCVSVVHGSYTVVSRKRKSSHQARAEPFGKHSVSLTHSLTHSLSSSASFHSSSNRLSCLSSTN